MGGNDALKLAAKCRRTAGSVSDGPMQESFARLAQEYEQVAAQQSGRCAAGAPVSDKGGPQCGQP